MSLRNINCVGDDCCGCAACYAVCPRDAIYCERGPRGELLYKANEACINCGKCLKVCPTKNAKLNDQSDIFFRAITKQEDVLLKSSSGGIAYEVGRRVIQQNGVIYAATWNVEKQCVKHARIVSMQELPAIQGSKYVQSLIY